MSGYTRHTRYFVIMWESEWAGPQYLEDCDDERYYTPNLDRAWQFSTKEEAAALRSDGDILVAVDCTETQVEWGA